MDSDDLPLFSRSSGSPNTPPNPAPDVGFVRSATQLSASAKNAEPISVSELNRRVKGLLEANFELRWVRGELSNVMRAASGHWYFSLKDDSAQVRCVMFRHRAQSVAFTPENGIEVDIRALPSLYEARGEFQLGVEAMRRAGVGALFEAFERLKRKLAAEGLFDEARKRVLPDFPRTVGIVTSTKAAALRDVLATFKRRAPMVNIIIYPTAVQGADAAREIAAAIDIAAKRHEVEALLICRGGGAAEDLWSFNEEVVARALARFQTETHIPVVSGVGHETDFTICDFVADVRAPTPTAAAELLSPDMAAMRLQLTQQASQLLRSTTRVLGRLQQRLDLAARGLLSPEQRIQRERELLNQFAGRLSRGLQWAYASQRQRFLQQRSRLLANAPDIRQRREHLKSATASVDRAVATALSTRRTALAQHAQALLLLNPEHVLLRGYAMVTRPTTEGGAVGSVMSAVVTSSAQLKPADRVTLRFHDGKADAEIK